MLRFLCIVLAAAGVSAHAQLSQLEATRIAETILSNQNPLIVVEEIAHDGLFIAPQDRGYRVVVDSPRLPGRVAFMDAMEFLLTPVDGDLVQVQITGLPQSAQTSDQGSLTLRPTVFNGLFSRADRGFQSLQFGVNDLVYMHPDLNFSLGRLDVDLRNQGGVYTLTLNVKNYKSDVQDTMDFRETMDGVSIQLSMDQDFGNGGDLLFIANAVAELIADPGHEETNLLGKERPLPDDLMSLKFDIEIQGMNTAWLALVDGAPRRTISETQIRSLSLRGGIVPHLGDTARATLDVAIDGVDVVAPGALLNGTLDQTGFNLTLDGLDSRRIAQLFSDEAGAQSAALGHLLGHMSGLQMQALMAGIDVQIPDQDAVATLRQGRLDLGLSRALDDAPNYKNLNLTLKIQGMEGDYPSETQALEPAWSAFVAPALPDLFNLQLAITSIPGPLWQAVAGLFVDTDLFPDDRTTPPDLPALDLDGTTFQSTLFNATLGGDLVYNPDAQFGAVGDIDLTISNLRPVIGAMQQGARVPNRMLSQALTLGSIGLATIMGMAERTEDGQMRFAFTLGESGLPTINGQDLPLRF